MRRIEIASVDCPHCGGGGYLRPDVSSRHPLFGQLIPCQCIKTVMEQERIAGLQQRARLPRRQRGERFETWRPDGLNDSVFEKMQGFAADPNSRTLYLYGPSSRGKTMLAASVLNDRLSRGMGGLFFVVPDLLDYLKSAFHPSSPVRHDELFEEIKRSEMLVLDDLRTEHSSSWALEKLFQILNSRYNEMLPTIITSKVAPADVDPLVSQRVRSEEVDLLQMR